MNCNDCGGFLPRGCTCSPFGGRDRKDDEAFRQHQRDRIAEAQRHDAELTRPKLLADPLDVPLPADVRVGHNVFRKGVSLSTFVEAARRWHREAFPENYAMTDEQRDANLARLQGKGPDHA